MLKVEVLEIYKLNGGAASKYKSHQYQNGLEKNIWKRKLSRVPLGGP